MGSHREAAAAAIGLDVWTPWVNDSLHQLRASARLRTPRPVIALKSSAQALISQADLDAWVAGRDPVTVSYTTHWQGPPSSTSGADTHRTASLDAATSWQAAASPTASPTDTLVPLTLFSLNDYLGLASHPEVCEAAETAARQVGMGPRSSAIVGGTTAMHRELEQGLADLKGTEECLLFPTGFAANMAVVSALCAGGGVDVFSDELNHASIVDGARLAIRSGTSGSTADSNSGNSFSSGSHPSSSSPAAASSSGSAGDAGGNRLYVYRHNDLAHLEQLLQRAATGSGAQARHRRQLVITDSLFSMDGDFADLKGLCDLKRRYGFLLVVDEAHATLVCGERGAGAAEAMGVAEQVDIHVGTLSKAFGALGGFAACTASLKSYLLNKGRSYIYSTALPLPVVAAAQAALRVSARESWRRQHLWSLVERLGELLHVPALSPIVPLVLGPEQAAMEAGNALLAGGRHVPAIRPPTVPPGTCRLRVSLSAAHSMRQVEELAQAVNRCGFRLQRLPFLEQQQRQRLLTSGPGSVASVGGLTAGQAGPGLTGTGPVVQSWQPPASRL